MKQVESYTNADMYLILIQLENTEHSFCSMAVLLRRNQNLNLRRFY